MTKLLTIKAAGEALSLHGSTVRRRVEAGLIPVVNVGRPGGRPRLRISAEALAEYAARNELEISSR